MEHSSFITYSHFIFAENNNRLCLSFSMHFSPFHCQRHQVDEDDLTDDEDPAQVGAGAVNQYGTPEPHLYLEMAFELGLKALESLDVLPGNLKPQEARSYR